MLKICIRSKREERVEKWESRWERGGREWSRRRRRKRERERDRARDREGQRGRREGEERKLATSPYHKWVLLAHLYSHSSIDWQSSLCLYWKTACLTFEKINVTSQDFLSTSVTLLSQSVSLLLFLYLYFSYFSLLLYTLSTSTDPQHTLAMLLVHFPLTIVDLQ